MMCTNLEIRFLAAAVAVALCHSALIAAPTRGDEATGAAASGLAYANPPMPRYRILATGFDASEQDIRRLLDSTGRELWRYFPDCPIEPFVVRRGTESPIVRHQRNEQREIVMLLNSNQTYWSQYAYQFAHEFCHILCRYDDDYKGNQWFEEALCETASLFALRAMSRAWETDPPYPHWRDYRGALEKYAAELIEKSISSRGLCRHRLE